MSDRQLEGQLLYGLLRRGVKEVVWLGCSRLMRYDDLNEWLEGLLLVARRTDEYIFPGSR